MAQLKDQIEKRYLDYAQSVIMSRALPDARDGLKPVQRRILYAMWKDLKLTPGVKHRKSAAIVGTVLGSYHPHGDTSVYDAMVRMAQEFSLRYPLVDPHGNFGSIDGDNAASMRYTEARLAPMAERILEELNAEIVAHQDNYDSTRQEPTVLPSQIPNLLMNGAQGIAVGMATNIPPHNLSELMQALCQLIDDSEVTLAGLLKSVTGPDFPTGGRVIATSEELTQVYTSGHGGLTCRAVWEVEDAGRGKQRIVVTEIPFQVNKAKLYLKIATAVVEGEVPQIEEVRDESTDDIRLVFDLAKGADPETVLAYLFKHTDLQSKFHYNLTALVPKEPGSTQLVPRQCGLKELLEVFLQHRQQVVRARLEGERTLLERRVHILEGFETVLQDVDRLVALVRSASGKAEARKAVESHFKLAEKQADAVVSQALYRLASTQVQDILDELARKRQESARITGILDSPQRLMALIRQEFVAIREHHTPERRTEMVDQAPSFVYEEEAYIPSEDVIVVLSRAGWIRQQKSYTDITTLRCREDDEIGWVLKANTRDTLTVFTSLGQAYSLRVHELTQTTGYGDPIQARFTFSDGEAILSAVLIPVDTVPTAQWVALSSDALIVRFDLDGYHEPSQTKGRTYLRLAPDQEVRGVHEVVEGAHLMLATRMGKGITFSPSEVRLYKGAGKGIRALKLAPKDDVLGSAICGQGAATSLVVETNRGAERVLTPQSYPPQRRGGKGYNIIKRGHLVRVHQPVTET
jgi:DNA gyrase subunit A